MDSRKLPVVVSKGYNEDIQNIFKYGDDNKKGIYADKNKADTQALSREGQINRLEKILWYYQVRRGSTCLSKDG